MARKLKVGVLFGGRSAEHEVSLVSATSVIKALDKNKYDIIPIGISPQGKWLSSSDAIELLKSGRQLDHIPEKILLPDPSRKNLVALTDGTSEGASLDVIFPLLHGTFGEDGTVQGLFELAAVPYAGAGVLGSALGMDKVIQKTLWRGMGLPVVDFVSLRRRDLENDLDAAMNRVELSIGYPCFTKPANLGSSVGVSKALNRAELELGLHQAAQYDAKLLVERGVDARELECGVLGNDEPIASVVGEIVPGADFYAYRAKYLDTGSQALIPADISANLADEVRRMAVAAFKAVDAAGLARVDFFLERGTDRLYLNEINTMPGFTEISMYPKLWQASGVSFSELVTRVAELGIERFAERARNETTFRAE